MASKTLFPPIVEYMQPAVTVDSNITITFSLSDYNSDGDFDKIRVSLIDPNKASGWGANSMLNEYIDYKEYYKSALSFTSGKYTITIDQSEIQTLVANQFYQAQVWLVKDSEVSAPSQITLIRAIPEIGQLVTYPASGQEILELDKIEGAITYSDGSTIEQISSVTFEIAGETASKTYYNYSGATSFSINTDDIYLIPGAHTLNLTIKTINGYVLNETVDFNIAKDSFGDAPLNEEFYVENDLNNNCIKIICTVGGTATTKQVYIQRSDSLAINKWKTIHVFNKETTTSTTFNYKDFNVENKKIYNYRVIAKHAIGQRLIPVVDNRSETEFKIKCSAIEYPILADKDYRFMITYNPSITNFKWVTQETITNTIGGRYPIVIASGDVLYRQFSISGTMSFFGDAKNDSKSADSRGIDFQWTDPGSIMISNSKQTEIESIISSLAENPDALEKYYRQLFQEFLINKQVKLFNSPEEGPMLVYLSAISFTPNKQLGNTVVDFTATVTEVCECTLSNLKKYSFVQDSSSGTDFSQYKFAKELLV